MSVWHDTHVFTWSLMCKYDHIWTHLDSILSKISVNPRNIEELVGNIED